MQLQDILYSQGFGTRRVCAGLVQQGYVELRPDGGTSFSLETDAAAECEEEGLTLRVQGVEWPYQAKAYVVLHKPAGTECSQKPSTYPSIYTLLPAPLRQRPSKTAVMGVQAVGRLDQLFAHIRISTVSQRVVSRHRAMAVGGPRAAGGGLRSGRRRR